MVASVRPWKPPSKVMISCAPLVAASKFARELDRAFVGFGAGIGKEHLIEAAVGDQRLASFRLGPL